MSISQEELNRRWYKNVFNAIKDISDVEFQRLVWLDPENSPYISSFEDILDELDDVLFEDYIEYYESLNGRDIIYKLLCELNVMLGTYEDIGYKLADEFSWKDAQRLIFHDPHWVSITEKAREVVEALRTSDSRKF